MGRDWRKHRSVSEEFGPALKATYENAGFSQADVARGTDINKGTVSAITNGIRTGTDPQRTALVEFAVNYCGADRSFFGGLAGLGDLSPHNMSNTPPNERAPEPAPGRAMLDVPSRRFLDPSGNCGRASARYGLGTPRSSR
jgi:transcriptional regulator with XRE-family HTH domain